MRQSVVSFMRWVALLVVVALLLVAVVAYPVAVMLAFVLGTLVLCCMYCFFSIPDALNKPVSAALIRAWFAAEDRALDIR